MKLLASTGVGRTRWLAVFTVFLSASCAAPVLAEPPEKGVETVEAAGVPATEAEAPTPPEKDRPPEEVRPIDEKAIAEEVAAVEREEIANEEVVSENGALVSDGEGSSELIESPIPIRSRVPGEEGKIVDLDLKASSGGGFEAKTPATADVHLPGLLGGEVKIGEELGWTDERGPVNRGPTP